MSNTSIISKPKNQYDRHYKNGNTADIMKVLIKTLHTDISKDVECFSKNFSLTKHSMRDLWSFAKFKIVYKRDPKGYQFIQTPSRLYNSGKGVGDCKSKTVFIVAVLQNLGLVLGESIKIRFAGYEKLRKGEKPQAHQLTHVYPLAKINNEWVIIDSVWSYFNSEQKPQYKQDYPSMSKIEGVEIAVLSGTASPQNVVESIKSDIDNFDIEALKNRSIVLNQHCYGCTAGAGSSCGGEIA